MTPQSLSGALRELLKFPDHPLIGLPLERHHEAGQVAHRDPAPIDEFRLVSAGGRGDVDLPIVAGETQREPFLLLPAIFAAPRLADDGARDVVSDPAGDLAELFDR